MKQTPKNIHHIAFQLLLFGCVIFVAAILKFQPSPAVPTTPAPSPTPVKATNTSASTAKYEVKLAHSSTKSSARTVSLSPKQDQIKQSVNHEVIYHMFAAPNDPLTSSNWALAKINAPAAWNVATGNGQTVVAVIDGGFGLNHEDLASRWYQSGGESGMTQAGERCWTGTPADKKSNSCDDDDNGYVDDWRGWSFVDGDNNPQAGLTSSTGSGVSHATEVSGLIGAETNNGLGMAALDWNTKIMPLQALDDDGSGYTSDVTAAVYYAVDNGAKVINLSLGAYGNDPYMEAAVDYATAHNVVVVAAAGNCGDGVGAECDGVPAGTVAFPAAYPDVIAVGAITSTDQRPSFGSFGTALDVSAPGFDVPLSTAWSADNDTSLYATHLFGTSFASPMVASLAALIKSIRPSTSINDVTAIIDATANKPTSMGSLAYSPQFGHGIINAGTALSIVSLLNGTPANVPSLLQAGTNLSEHTMSSGTPMTSGCQVAAGTACTVQMTDSITGYKRFLPYTIVPVSGSTGWTWSSDALGPGSWEIRARRGDNLSSLPYMMLEKG
jgi:hypothetical protein